jgi:AraC-like DNA-binding protein/mannose-6-phosphate isomerase-like protein (cupin superfamily)
MQTLEKQIRDHRFADLVTARTGTMLPHLPILIWSDTIDRHNESALNRHLDFMSLYVVRSGRGTHYVDGAAFGVSRGDVYVMGMGNAHYFARCHALELHTIHFSPEIFDAETRRDLASMPGYHPMLAGQPGATAHPDAHRWLHLTPDAYLDVSADLNELRAEYLSGTVDGALMVRAGFLRLLIRLSRRCAAAEHRPFVRPRGEGAEATVAAAIHLIDERFREPIRIEEIAAAVCLSPDRFTEVFVAVTGRTPRDYLRHVRIEQAKSLLRNSSASITHIAHEAGFAEASYFSRVFRQEIGTTPMHFRRTRGGEKE